jgi:hypothetical protein
MLNLDIRPHRLDPYVIPYVIVYAHRVRTPGLDG